MTPEQYEKVTHIHQLFNDANSEVCDAFESSSSYMSDAKSAVFDLLSDIQDDSLLEPHVRNDLLNLANQAFRAIGRGSSASPQDRAGNCLFYLRQLGEYINHLLK